MVQDYCLQGTISDDADTDAPISFDWSRRVGNLINGIFPLYIGRVAVVFVSLGCIAYCRRCSTLILVS